MERLHLLVSGRVQGVGFRAAARRQANGLHLTGYIRNLPDGRVEVIAEGKRGALEIFSRWVGEGPPFARVDDLSSSWGVAENIFSAFEIR